MMWPRASIFFPTETLPSAPFEPQPNKDAPMFPRWKRTAEAAKARRGRREETQRAPGVFSAFSAVLGELCGYQKQKRPNECTSRPTILARKTRCYAIAMQRTYFPTSTRMTVRLRGGNL